ncbi:MAG: hypothetical protein M1836_005703 [Candelina mexicana]|nr:MAG: hypothetical protein M1836_005703 [Candelina mexicana]
MGWFGSLDLAYKYGIVLGSLLLFVVLLGVLKVVIAKRKIKQHIKKADLEAAGKTEERHELNTRELDEGDLFGVRAIESGYFGGVAQSRPTSLAASPISSRRNSMANTLTGKQVAPKIVTSSPSSSVTNLPTAHSPPRGTTYTPVQDDEIGVAPPTNRRVPSAMNLGLRPSQAELTGRHNLDPAVDMNLNVPPSPVMGRMPRSGGSDTSSEPNSPSFPLNGKRRTESFDVAPLALHDDTDRSARQIPTPNNPAYNIKSEAASIVSGTESNSSLQGQSRQPPRNLSDMPFPSVPSRGANKDQQPGSVMDRPRGAPGSSSVSSI